MPGEAGAARRGPASVFDVCHAGVVLRTLLAVEAAVGLGTLFVAADFEAWSLRFASTSAVAVPAVLLWLSTACLAKRPLGVLVPVQGVVDVPPQNLVSVSAPLGGYLRGTDLLPGMEIQQGQTLAVMEDPRFIQLQQDYLVAKGKVELLQQDVERQRALNATKTASDKVLQEVTTELNTQRITMRALAEQLRLIGVGPEQLSADNISRSVALRSPIHGWVAKVNVNIGRYVQPTDVLFELVKTRGLA